MVVRSNKPFLFSVEHDPKAVESALPNFRNAINGKKFLFIELTPPEVKAALRGEADPLELVAAYQKLVTEAARAGLKVVALDRPKFMEELLRAEIDASIIGPNHEKDKAKVYYEDYIKRERDWLRTLSNAGSNSVLVMNPGHAAEIAKQLKLPKEHIFGQLWPRTKERLIAAGEAARIEKARLEKSRRRAQQRMRRRK